MPLLGRCITVFAFVSLFVQHLIAAKPNLPPPITVTAIPRSAKFPLGVEPDSLWLACAPLRQTLKDAFSAHGLRYSPTIERSVSSGVCHVWYEPTIPSFRAHADNEPVKELFMDVSLLAFVTNRPEVLGDSYDIASLLLPQLNNSVNVTFGLAQDLPAHFYQEALDSRFSRTPHKFGFRRKAWQSYDPWTQDYFKSGHSPAGQKILVSRRSYETGRDGVRRFVLLEDSFADPRFVRSKLAWEGGDIQFLESPAKPGKLVLVHGHAAVRYWADRLSEAEYSYVLQEEFGADEVWNVSRISPHADYFMLPVPTANTLLIGQPVAGSLTLAREAFGVLADYYSVAATPHLRELRALLESPGNPLVEKTAAIRLALQRAKATHKIWFVPLNTALIERVQRYSAKNCPGSPKECLSPGRIQALLETDPVFIRDWASTAVLGEDYSFVHLAMLGLIESQLPGFRAPEHARLESLAKKAQEEGWRVIRVPFTGFEPALNANWAGLSYANVFANDRQIFVPQFGLPRFEEAFYQRLGAELPGYSIIPIFSRHSMLHNGGIHCVLGIIRDLSSPPPPRSPQ